jgi:hypothetical protein
VHTQIDTKTHRRPRHHAKAPVTTQRPPVWRPQQVGLSRDELRRIVLDQLG